jgi:hypothetical protein
MSTDARPTPDVEPTASGTGTPPNGPAAPTPKLDPNTDKLPLTPEGWAYLADLKWVNEEYNRGTWDQYAGNYIAVARKQLLGHGADLPALRERTARECGLDPDRILVIYVEPPIIS